MGSDSFYGTSDRRLLPRLTFRSTSFPLPITRGHAEWQRSSLRSPAGTTLSAHAHAPRSGGVGLGPIRSGGPDARADAPPCSPAVHNSSSEGGRRALGLAPRAACLDSTACS